MRSGVFLITLLSFALMTVPMTGQNYIGPAQGSVANGVVVTTDDFDIQKGSETQTPFQYRKPMEYDSGPVYYEGNQPVFDNYVYVDDINAQNKSNADVGISFELQSFQSISMTSSIPPDNHMAVGPDHVIAMVNGRFHIYDRSGSLLKNISDDAWVLQVINHPTVTDPQVIYDHYENRWIMLWLTVNDGAFQSSMTVCCSDDENPLGTWYMYALNGSVNGTANSNAYGDYPQLGYDDIGIYISSREFFFAGGFAGGKIKIIDKSELYGSNGGQLTFNDIWNIRLLNGGSTDDLHPCISYDAGTNEANFIIVPNSGSVYSLYKLSDPLNNPVFSGTDFNVPFFNTAPNANQLGGGTPPISANGTGSGITNAPIIRDGLLYATHHIRNSQFTAYSSIKYFVINLNTNQVVEQSELGAQGYFYLFPAIVVDQDHNIAITYSRSADTEYIGSYYSTKLAADPPGLSPSKTMVEGQGNYVVTFGGTINRWGDYLSAALDPVNEYNIWLYSEYAAATNIWGTWLTEIRMKPFETTHMFVSTETINFGDIEVGTSSSNSTVVIANYGDQDLEITEIPASVGDFYLENNLTFPITLETYDSLEIEFSFTPTSAGETSVLYSVTSNDPNFSSLTLTGNGYMMYPALDRTIYASSGSQNSGEILTIDQTTGAGTNIGSSLFSEVKGISIDPNSGIIYGLIVHNNESDIVRVNSGSGDSYRLFTVDIGSMADIAFDTSGTLYGISRTGDVYTFDIENGTYSFVVEAAGSYTGVAFHPTTNELWAASRSFVPPNKDAIFKVNLTTGDTTIVGHTGLGLQTNDIVFDENGSLYGIVGSSGDISDFISIDVSTGIGTIIGSVGLKNIVGLAYEKTGVTSVEEPGDVSVASDYRLSQNYPNPFNPNTSIEFTVPVNSDVRITIYNLLGQVVTKLMDDGVNRGRYSVVWNGNDEDGLGVSSGIYFYEMKANGINGTEYKEMKKMILLK